MLKNYLLVVLRFFSRQRGFSIINILGLTIGVTCSLLLMLYVQDELSFDTFHRDAERIHRIAFRGEVQEKVLSTTLTGFPLGRHVSTLDAIHETCRLATWKTFPVQYDSQTFTTPYLLLADSNFFDFFTFGWIHGKIKTALTGDRKVVISESIARQHFGYNGPADSLIIGKKVLLAQGYEAEISGIAADPPANAHFHYTMILSLSSWEKSEHAEWLDNKVLTYVKLADGESIEKVNEAIEQSVASVLDTALRQTRSISLERYRQEGNEIRYFLQPLRRIHLHSNLSDEIEQNGNIDYIVLFSTIAAVIILLACINFMNLTTAQSANRAKEVAVRKAVGAQNNPLMLQFLIESYFYVIIAVVFALFAVLVAVGPFNFFTGKQLTFGSVITWPFALGIILFVLVTGLVAGSYPAFYLTSYSPVEVLKGNLRARLRSYGIRNVLVVFQFMISAGLLVATMIVYQQVQYVRRAPLGFDKENIINLLHTRNLDRNGHAFKEHVLKVPGVLSASYCNRVPPNVEWQALFRLDSAGKDFTFAVYEMDADHLQTLGYTMASGRFFSSRGDSSSIILNETAAKILRINNPAGQRIYSTYDAPSSRGRRLVGIIQDFNFQSLKDPIQPLAIIPGYEPNWEMAIRVQTGAGDAVLTEIERLFRQHAPGAPFEYSVLEKNFQAKHDTEKRIGMLFLFFTTLAIIIACLGLFGLATFTAEKQRKEIGIRKVLGASIPNILMLLNRNFLRLVLIANIAGLPLAWWLMHAWLSQFAYRVAIPWWTFAIAFAGTLLIAFLSVSSKAIRAARGNPVNSLKNE